MTSQCNKTAAALALLLAIGSWPLSAPAGVYAPAAEARDNSLHPSVNQRPANDRELTTSREASGRNRSGSLMQCWQKGRLIMDERNWRSAGMGLPGPVLYSNSGPYARMKLMRFGEAFCTLRYGAR